MFTNESKIPISQAAADTPQPPKLTPEEALAQLRNLQAQLPDVTELTARERTVIKRSTRINQAAIEASLGVLDVSDDVAHVVGQPDDVRQLVGDSGRWVTFENELKATLRRVSDANVIRRKRIRVLAVQAYLIGQQVARTPGNGNLETHVTEVKRLRGHRSKATPAPDGGTSNTPAT